MAQHMEVRNSSLKVLQKIGASIEKEVAKGLSHTSMKWQRHEYGGRVWWETSRYIGKGIVYGDTRGLFEVWVEGKVAKHIYLVA